MRKLTVFSILALISCIPTLVHGYDIKEIGNTSVVSKGLCIFDWFKGPKGDRGEPGPQGPKGDKGDKGDSCEVPVTGFVYYVDSSYQSGFKESNGSIAAPFSTIQQALNAAKSSGRDPFEPTVIYVNPGSYEEDIVIQDLCRISIVALGPVEIGSRFGGDSGDCRLGNITWTISEQTAFDGFEPSLLISQAAQGVMGQNSSVAMNIYGGIHVYNRSQQLAHMSVSGVDLGCMFCVQGSVELDVLNSLFSGKVSGDGLILNKAQSSIFAEPLEIFSYGSIFQCALENGLEVQSMPIDFDAPVGIIQSVISGQFAGPDQSLIVDAYTNQCFVPGGIFGNEATISRGSKVVIGSYTP